MNELVTVSKDIALPSDALGMMSLANQLCKASGIPSIYKNPADLCMALIVLHDLGIKNPLLALQEIQPVRNNWMFSGKLCLGLANTSGRFAERLTFEHLGEGDERKVIVRGRLHGETEARIVEVKLKEVRTGNEVWKKQPDQQLVYAGARIWLRRHAPEIILGMYFEGEIIDVTPTTTTVSGTVAPLRLDPALSQGSRAQEIENKSQGGNRAGEDGIASKEAAGTRVVDGGEPAASKDRVPAPSPSQAELAATMPFEFTNAQATNWGEFEEKFLAYVRAAPDADTINEWTTVNAQLLQRMLNRVPERHRDLINQINHQIAMRAEGGT